MGWEKIVKKMEDYVQYLRQYEGTGNLSKMQNTLRAFTNSLEKVPYNLSITWKNNIIQYIHNTPPRLLVRTSSDDCTTLQHITETSSQEKRNLLKAVCNDLDNIAELFSMELQRIVNVATED